MDPVLLPQAAVSLPGWLMWDEWIKAFIEENTISTYAMSYVLYFIVMKKPWKGGTSFLTQWFKKKGGGGAP